MCLAPGGLVEDLEAAACAAGLLVGDLELLDMGVRRPLTQPRLETRHGIWAGTSDKGRRQLRREAA